MGARSAKTSAIWFAVARAWIWPACSLEPRPGSALPETDGSAEQRAGGLQFIANNSRFLILPWVRVRLLASHLLSQIACRINRDWQSRYGHRLYLLETFVQADRFRGTSYQAANWLRVGQTTGRTRQDRYHRVDTPCKDIYLYPLGRDVRQELCR